VPEALLKKSTLASFVAELALTVTRMPAIRSLSAVVIVLGAICSAMLPEDEAAYPAYWPGAGRQAMYGEAGGKS
jgi:hypothetical protein